MVPTGAPRLLGVGLLVIAALVAALAPRIPASRGFADPATPPAPPTYVPTPIGPPPAPPTLTPVTGATATAVPATPTATATATSLVSFSLDAARVGQVHNRGDMSGLADAVPGSHVWLMIYFTVKSLSFKAVRHSTYEVERNGKILFKATYADGMKAHETGRFSRYIDYQIPRTFPYGRYTFKAVMSIGKQTQSKSWKFALAKHARMAAVAKTQNRPLTAENRNSKSTGR